METIRTLKNLRDTLSGKIYIYLKDANTKKKFLTDAKTEGYRFGKSELPVTIEDNIVSLKKNRQICYVGSVGRIEFQCNGGDNSHGKFHRIDYARYKRGNEDYYYCFDPSERIKEINSYFHGVIGVAGDKCEEAVKFLLTKKPIASDDEENLFSFVEKKYGVIVAIDNN